MDMQLAMPGRRGVRSPVTRRASHIYPGMINVICAKALLPGETVRDLYVDGRVFMKGMQSILFPWYLDIGFFKVNIVDLDPAYAVTFLNERGSPLHVGASGEGAFFGENTSTESYVKQAYKVVCDQFYSLEGASKDAIIAGVTQTDHRVMPRRGMTKNSSLVEGAVEDEDLRPDELDPEQYDDLVEDVDTYREFLRQYGVRRMQSGPARPERIMAVSKKVYPIYSAPDDAAESLTDYEALWTVSESRLTSSGIYVDQPSILLGVVCVRPEVLEGNDASFYVNEMLGRDRWFMPPFNALDAVADLIFSPSGTAWTTPASSTQRNALDALLHGESYGAGYADNRIRAAVGTLPAHAGSGAEFVSDWCFRDWGAGGYGANAFTYLPNLLNTSWLAGWSFATGCNIRTHLVAP